MKNLSIIVLATVLVTGIVQAKEPANKSRPNVILILSDDMGYSDLPKFGKSEIPTPNIDRLAENIDLGMGVLPGCRIEHQEAGMRRGGVELFYHTVDFLQFGHQLLFVLQLLHLPTRPNWRYRLVGLWQSLVRHYWLVPR